MHWTGSLFLCLCGILLVIWFVPLRIRFMMEYQKGWKAAVTVSALWLSRTFELPGDFRTGQKRTENTIAGYSSTEDDYTGKYCTEQNGAEPDRTLRKRLAEYLRARLQSRFERTSFQIQWRQTADSAAVYLKTMVRHVRLAQYQVRCRIGFSRPDITAYSYGMFWAVLSAMPQAWLQNGTITYLPDFQENRQEVYADGIIYCRVGKIIRMMVSVFRLTAAAMPEQSISAGNRKEQIVYES